MANITIPASGTGTATPEVATADLGAEGHLQRMLLEGFAGLSLNDAAATGAGTAIGPGQTTDIESVVVNHAMRVTHANAATLVVALQGFFDDWQTIGEWKLTERASGSVLNVTAPCHKVRANITTISGGGATVDAYIVTR